MSRIGASPVRVQTNSGSQYSLTLTYQTTNRVSYWMRTEIGQALVNWRHLMVATPSFRIPPAMVAEEGNSN